MSDHPPPSSHAAVAVEDDDFGVREQDRLLPIANVSRIMKRGLPDNAKIAKEAKDCVQECVSEFISFITSEATDRCMQEKRKTINGEDIIYAMSSLGFDNYSETMKVYIEKFRESRPESQKKTVEQQIQQLQQQMPPQRIPHMAPNPMMNPAMVGTLFTTEGGPDELASSQAGQSESQGALGQDSTQFRSFS